MKESLFCSRVEWTGKIYVLTEVNLIFSEEKEKLRVKHWNVKIFLYSSVIHTGQGRCQRQYKTYFPWRSRQRTRTDNFIRQSELICLFFKWYISAIYNDVIWSKNEFTQPWHWSDIITAKKALIKYWRTRGPWSQIWMKLCSKIQNKSILVQFIDIIWFTLVCNYCKREASC